MTVKNTVKILPASLSRRDDSLVTDCTVIQPTIVPGTMGIGEGFDEVFHCHFLIKIVSGTIVRRKIIGTIIERMTGL